MIKIRPAAARGHAHHGWLDTWHSFSFADYYDPAQLGWGPLRVINDDTIAPGGGFPRHGHRDMEIVTYVLSGTLSHGDSMDNARALRRPDIQRMSAGRGLEHAEFNASADKPVHLLQIWIEPAVRGLDPEYEQKGFPDDGKRGRWQPLVSGDGRGGSMIMHQDAVVSATLLAPGEVLRHEFEIGRRAYLHVVRGRVEANGVPLKDGDGARMADEERLAVVAQSEAEALLFELP